MSYYLLRYDRVVDHYVERRAPFREAHLALIRDAHARGEIVMAGTRETFDTEAVRRHMTV